MTSFDIEKRIRAARISKGLSQYDLAFKVDMDQSHYSKFERGKASLSISCIAKILEVLELEIFPKSASRAIQRSSFEIDFLKKQNEQLERQVRLIERMIKIIKRGSQGK